MRIRVHAHIRYQLMPEVLECNSLASLRSIVARAAGWEKDGGFVFDKLKEKKQKEALELKKWQEETRKRFEGRLVRKAQRAGLPSDHFLKQGSATPTAAQMRAMKAMEPAAAWDHWKATHGQHCWALHFESGGCPRARTCAFIHAEIVYAEGGGAKADANDPTWLQEKNGG
jgi:hypothetical protein